MVFRLVTVFVESWKLSPAWMEGGRSRRHGAKTGPQLWLAVWGIVIPLWGCHAGVQQLCPLANCSIAWGASRSIHATDGTT